MTDPTLPPAAPDPAPVIRKPWITLAFYNDGSVVSIPGPGRFPSDLTDVNRTMGAVLVVLYQIAQAGYERMLAKVSQAQAFSIQEELKRALMNADPVSDKEM